MTNADGRTAAPLISGDRLETGVYELVFHAGDYFRSAGLHADRIRRSWIRSSCDSASLIRIGNYHVPLLLSPYGYSTYRGS